MHKKIVLYILLFLFGLNHMFGQVRQSTTKAAKIVNCKVIDAKTGEPLPGITVRVKNSNNGVVTDFDGKFTITTELGDVLILSCMGYKKETHTVSNSLKNQIFKLTKSLKSMQAITIIGYGEKKKQDVIGSVGSIQGKELDPMTMSLDNALIGKIAGVMVNSSSGAPGSATSITIRGLTSLNPNSGNPLIVIDGVPIYGSSRKNNTVGFERSTVPGGVIGGGSVSNALPDKKQFERNPLSMLNINDIKSIEVLKDAYATAIYGSRGAAGVILITTKSGIGKPQVRLNYSTTLSEPIGTPDILNATQYSEFYNTYYNSNLFPTGEETNWLDEVTRTAVSHNLYASYSAGDEKMDYYLSFSQSDQEAYIINQDYKKYTARINADYDYNEKLKIGANIGINAADNHALNAQAIYRRAVLKAPNVRTFTDLNTYYFGYAPNYRGDLYNPVAHAYRDINYVKDTRTLGNVFVEYEPFDNVKLKSMVGVDHFTSESYSRLINRPQLEGGNATQTTKQNRKFVVSNTLTFKKGFNKHFINGVLGQSFETSREQYTSIFGRKFNSDKVLAIGRAGENGVMGSQIREWALFSAFARLNYQYDNKYLAGITYRVDGSSRFNKNHRYVGFPSFALGWQISEESFMNDLEWVSDLKVRGSAGFTGIDGTSGYYGNQGQYVFNSHGLQYNGVPILQVQQPNNPNLEWEKTMSIDLGLNADLFKHTLNFEVDYYYKKTTNMLYASAVPLYMGYVTQLQNIGDMVNKGIEVSINSTNLETLYFKWTTSFNISKNRNKILKLNFEGSNVTGPELGYKYFAEGEPASQFFLYDWAGVDPLTGNPLWNYPDGTQSTTPPASLDDPNQYRLAMGTAMPEFYGGLSNSFTYKNLDLHIFFSFSYGGQLYNGSKALLMTYSQDGANNLSTDILNHWLIPGHRTDIPKIHNASIITNGFGGRRDYTVGRDSDRFLEDNSYLRLKNIKLAYHFDQRFMKALSIEDLTVYIQGNNLLTLTNYSGVDPSVSAFGSSALLKGYDELTMPQTKSYSIGVNIGF